MKKLGFKVMVGLLFSVFATLSKTLFTMGELPIESLLQASSLRGSFVLFFGIGYIILGTVLWNSAQKNKQI